MSAFLTAKQKQSCWLPHVRGPEDGKLLPVIEATQVSHKNEKSHSPISSAFFNLHLWSSLFETSIKAIFHNWSLVVISLLMTGFEWKRFLQIILFIIKKFPSATILTASVLKFHLTIIHQETEKFCIAQFEKDLLTHLVLCEMQLKYSALPGSSSLFCCGLLIHILAKRFLQLGGLDKTFFCIYIK